MNRIRRFMLSARSLSLRHLNQMVDRLNDWGVLTGAPPITVSKVGGTGRVVGLSLEQLLPRIPKNLIHWGKPATAWNTGTTITLDPCTIAGVDIPSDNATVYVQYDQSSYTTSNGVTVPVTEIVPYVLGADGSWYVLGRPKVVLTDFQVDAANSELEVKTRDDWGLFCSTESAWVVKHVGDTC